MTNALASRQGALNPLKKANPKDVLQRVLNEESTKDIAASYGVTRSALNYWLLETAEKEWRSAQVLRALKRKEDAEDELETATDAFTLARARERLKAAQWDLERVCRRIYGQEAQVAVAHITVQLGAQLRGESATIAPQHEQNQRNGEVVDV